MVTTDIHFIHGEELGQQQYQHLSTVPKFSFQQLLNEHPNATHISLHARDESMVYQFKKQTHWHVIDANNGTEIAPISKTRAEQIAVSFLTAPLEIKQSILLTQQAPAELSQRHLPSWQVTFSHWSQPTLYIHQVTGDVLTKRHAYWRIFDWMWRFHIMDYDNGENVNNMLLTMISLISLIATLLGAILSFTWVKKKMKKRLL